MRRCTIREWRRQTMTIESLIAGFGFPIAVTIYLLYERQRTAARTQEERVKTLHYLEKAIKVDLVGAITDLKVEIVKLSAGINGGKR